MDYDDWKPYVPVAARRAKAEREAAEQQEPVPVLAHPVEDPAVAFTTFEAILEPLASTHACRHVVKLGTKGICREGNSGNRNDVKVPLMGEKGAGEQEGFTFDYDADEQQEVTVL